MWHSDGYQFEKSVKLATVRNALIRSFHFSRENGPPGAIAMLEILIDRFQEQGERYAK